MLWCWLLLRCRAAMLEHLVQSDPLCSDWLSAATGYDQVDCRPARHVSIAEVSTCRRWFSTGLRQTSDVIMLRHRLFSHVLQCALDLGRRLIWLILRSAKYVH